MQTKQKILFTANSAAAIGLGALAYHASENKSPEGLNTFRAHHALSAYAQETALAVTALQTAYDALEFKAQVQAIPASKTPPKFKMLTDLAVAYTKYPLPNTAREQIATAISMLPDSLAPIYAAELEQLALSIPSQEVLKTQGQKPLTEEIFNAERAKLDEIKTTIEAESNTAYLQIHTDTREYETKNTAITLLALFTALGAFAGAASQFPNRKQHESIEELNRHLTSRNIPL